MFGLIYKIIVGNPFYVGSTFDFIKRKNEHKHDAKTKQSKLYQAIRANDGLFDMVILHEFECENETELRIEERRVYDVLKPTLNTIRPFITEEEHKAFIKEYHKEYYTENADKLKAQQKEYQTRNADKIKAHKKEYQTKNADKIKAQKKEYRTQNADKIKAHKKEYYTQNADKIKAKNKEYRTQNAELCKCECGCFVEKTYLKKHQQTNKHISLMNKIGDN
tara:strand:+ start:754 stop:1416 length:663 start_codon:yes stop_codon:yes gene_type:complete